MQTAPNEVVNLLIVVKSFNRGESK